MVAFGTSGLRGLATDLLAGPGYTYSAAFAAMLLRDGSARPGDAIFVACDRRDSSPALTGQSISALRTAGLEPVFCGLLPTPALALHALGHGAAAIMVTGSHIPADRNGLKFYRPQGEIDKADEQAIGRIAAEAVSTVPAAATVMPPVSDAAEAAYLERYVGAFPITLLSGCRIGIYEHSTVAAGILARLIAALGATVVPVGHSERFVALDTEAVDDATRTRLAGWAREHKLDSVISADGDGDRPLVTDEAGEVIRGDALGVVAARFLGARTVVTPVSSNPGIGAHYGFEVVRTRIGSPYVIAAMEEAAAAGKSGIVGFEANGGVLTASSLSTGHGELAALPTRDSALPILCALAAARRENVPLSRLVADLGLPACLSGRIEDFARADSDRLMGWLRAAPANLARFLEGLGEPVAIEDVDGLQARMADGSTLHLRPSGNAPEMRCYASSVDGERARFLLNSGLTRIERYTERLRGGEA